MLSRRDFRDGVHNQFLESSEEPVHLELVPVQRRNKCNYWVRPSLRWFQVLRHNQCGDWLHFYRQYLRQHRKASPDDGSFPGNFVSNRLLRSSFLQPKQLGHTKLESYRRSHPLSDVKRVWGWRFSCLHRDNQQLVQREHPGYSFCLLGHLYLPVGYHANSYL